MRKLIATVGTGSRATEQTTRRLRAAVAVALAVAGTLLAAGPGASATHHDATGTATVGTTTIDHFPGVSGTYVGASSRCHRANRADAITVTINGVEIDHFPGLSGSPAGARSACTR